jgi:hypothetical protein
MQKKKEEMGEFIPSNKGPLIYKWEKIDDYHFM